MAQCYHSQIAIAGRSLYDLINRRAYLLAQGEVRVGRLHELWAVPFVLTLVFALNSVSYAASPSAYEPNLDLSNFALEHVPIPPAPTAASAKAKTAAGTSEARTGAENAASVLGASAYRGRQMNFGIATNLPAMTTPQLDAALSNMKSMGVTWVRYDMNWANIGSAGPGQYDWSNYDRVVSAVASYGLNSLPILDYTPTWAQDSACSGSQMCEPASASDFGQFAEAAASRYGPQGVRTWEIWNEPNISEFFQPAPDPGAYTALLQSAYRGIKSVEGGATVLTAGLAPAATDGTDYAPPDFLNGIYAAGAHGYFDGVGDHPYTWPYLPSFYLEGNAWSQLTTLHDIMVDHGDGGKKIWITEYGAPTGGPGGEASSGQTTAEGGDDHVTDGLQALMVTNAVDEASSYPWVASFFWYNYIDDGTSADTVENFFGLLTPTGARKPAYYAYVAAIASH